MSYTIVNQENMSNNYVKYARNREGHHLQMTCAQRNEYWNLFGYFSEGDAEYRGR